MQTAHDPVVFVVPGDLHLTKPGLDNYKTALWMTDEVNHLLRPDFVQFIGDNVQNAREEEFQLFQDLCARLTVPFHVLAGDHDVCGDPDAVKFRAFVGAPYGATALRGFRFLRLNTVEQRPLGLSAEQVGWFAEQMEAAHDRGERIVIFQHHYPFKVWEEFEGLGIEEWRQIVHHQRIAALFTGHTHYGQIANDGRNITITTRSIGDAEGGPPGYTLAYLHGEDLAASYRSIENSGPAVLIVHPREKLLATHHRHIVRGPDEVRVRTWSDAPVALAQGRVDEGDWFNLSLVSPNLWTHSLPGDRLAKGEHALEVLIVDANGRRGDQRIGFMVDPTGRYTAIPAVHPVVTGTAFC